MQKITKPFLLDTCDALETEPTPPASGIFYNPKTKCYCFVGHVLRRAGATGVKKTGKVDAAPYGLVTDDGTPIEGWLSQIPERSHLYAINDKYKNYVWYSWAMVLPELRSFIRTMRNF